MSEKPDYEKMWIRLKLKRERLKGEWISLLKLYEKKGNVDHIITAQNEISRLNELLREMRYLETKDESPVCLHNNLITRSVSRGHAQVLEWVTCNTCGEENTEELMELAARRLEAEAKGEHE